MKLLITGGAGFIGLNYIKYLQEVHPQYELICVDALTYAGRENQPVLEEMVRQGAVQFYEGRLEDGEFMARICAQHNFDGAINFAAETHVDRSIQNPQEFLVTNVIGTQVLLDMAVKYGIGRVHQISTDEVYGELPVAEKQMLFTESSPISPSSPYAASKASADLLVLAAGRTYDLDVTITRCSNNYGPYQNEEKLIPKVILNTIQNREIPVYGDGQQIRDWIYVGDHCRAIDLVFRSGRSGAVYNVGSSHEMVNLELIRYLLAQLGKSDGLIRFVTDRPGHDQRYGVDCQRLRNELGWQPEMPFEEGMQYTIEWYERYHKNLT